MIDPLCTGDRTIEAYRASMASEKVPFDPAGEDVQSAEVASNRGRADPDGSQLTANAAKHSHERPGVGR